MQSFWYERMWMVVTLILGILLLIRSLFILFFIEKIKKILPVFIGNYYKFTIPISITMVFLAFLIVTTDYIGPQKDISNCESDNQIQVICKFNNSEEWYQSIPKNVRPRKDQPFYHLLAENDDLTYEAYVSEQNLLFDDSEEPIKHPLINEIFSGKKGSSYFKQSN